MQQLRYGSKMVTGITCRKPSQKQTINIQMIIFTIIFTLYLEPRGECEKIDKWYLIKEEIPLFVFTLNIITETDFFGAKDFSIKQNLKTPHNFVVKRNHLSEWNITIIM